MPAPRRTYSSGAPWEPIVGYARAVRVGNHVHVSGTAAVDERGDVVGLGDPAVQMRQCLRTAVAALEALGAAVRHVVRTRIYVVDIGDWEVIGRVHGEVFGDVRPATSMVQVAALIQPDLLVEVEVEAIVSD
ncbi:MAG: RidA family protein [Gemmatimonadota bacterium]|nr:RidA family protein [Gemmatimonadota bacterium]MDH4350118.1 RidA family protein [Gemmatimonadota bacterium]MDH5195829.1 RidA family protein [Gemmatimonadota bacterium]